MLIGEKVMKKMARSVCICTIGTIMAVACATAARADGDAADGSTVGTAPEDTTKLKEIVVEERSDSMVGIADTSTQGTIGAQELDERAISRPGEVLEAMPGVIVTQHSGDGKANQYFSRGFNLDHGTDLATTVNGVPINLPSNAHGEGYTDLNFLIPELIQKIDYQKGPYFANVGDFGSAGSEDIEYFKTLPEGIAKVEVGSWNYERMLLADSTKTAGGGDWLYALELSHTDGPWTTPENYVKYNGLATYSQGLKSEGISVTFMGYHGTWDATNQVPDRAITEGLISRYGNLDPSDGGYTDRYTVEGEWHQGDSDHAAKISAYAYWYNMGLWNDFTFFLVDPVHGDQFKQTDTRWVQGIKGADTWFGKLGDSAMENTLGLDIRDDIIRDGLYHTEDREVLDVVRTDDVWETSLAPYYENKLQWLPWLRTVAGFREDIYMMHDQSNLQANSGTIFAAVPEPKFSAIFGPWAKTEFYVNAGEGFHTNDARGANTTEIVSSNSTGIANALSPTSKVTPLPQSQGAEVGVRTVAIPNLQSTLTFWILDLDSELVFDADDGTMDPSGPSRRIGFEWGNYYTPTKWLTVDADFSDSRARYRGNPAGGDYVPEAANIIVSTGIMVHDINNFSSCLRWRYFGPRALLQDDSERSSSTSLLYYDLSYQINPKWTVSFDIFNLLNAQADDITYYYATRLPGEPAEGVNDFMSHAAEPRTFRLGLTMKF